AVLPADVFAPPLDPSPEFVREYVLWDDTRVVSSLLGRPDTRAGQVMLALQNRSLMKRVARFSLADVEALFEGRMSGYSMEPDERVLDALTAEVEAGVALAAGVDPWWVSLYYEDLKNPVAGSTRFRLGDDDLILVGERGGVPFRSASELFRNNDVGGRK